MDLDHYEAHRRFYSSDKTLNGDKKSRFQSFRNTFPWNRPLELVSFMRTATESDKITNEDLENINKQETEIKLKQTFEKFFSRFSLFCANRHNRQLRFSAARTIPVDAETIQFMRDILDFFTHLGNYSVPVDTRLATIVVAGNDAYIPMEGVSHFHEVWDNRCDIRISEGIGHVEAYLRSSLWTDDRFRFYFIWELTWIIA